MSGSVGGDRLDSRSEYRTVFNDYVAKIKTNPLVRNVVSTGSYVSNKQKTTFGDMDLVIQLESSECKKDAKVTFANWLIENNLVSPFISAKYSGKQYLNTGEIITIAYNHNGKLYQIDNIISLTDEETVFKQRFLNLPAEKQGIFIGLVKVAMDNTSTSEILELLNTGIDYYLPGYRLSTNLSSTELSIRAELYEPGTFKVIDKKILWRSTDWSQVLKLVQPYQPKRNFEVMLNTISSKVSNPNIKQRIFGVLNSMVSVKSGEVNTPKGTAKQNAINIANKLLCH